MHDITLTLDHADDDLVKGSLLVWDAKGVLVKETK